jgi:hypothetical protein
MSRKNTDQDRGGYNDPEIRRVKISTAHPPGVLQDLTKNARNTIVKSTKPSGKTPKNASLNKTFTPKLSSTSPPMKKNQSL